MFTPRRSAQREPVGFWIGFGRGRPRGRTIGRWGPGSQDRLLAAAAGAGTAAVVTYLLDPDRGRRRRAMAANTVTHAAHEGADFTGKAGRDLRNRAAGAAAQTRNVLSFGPPSGEQLERRVRARINRVCRQPHRIDVAVRDDVVTLAGPVLREDAERVRRAVADMRGVGQLEDRLEVKEHPEDLPDAVRRGDGQVGGRPKPELLQDYWSPGVRLLAGAAGGGLACYGLARRDLVGAAAGGGGLLLLSRAATNLRVGRVTGMGAGRGAVQLQKTIQVDAPIEQVWELVDGYERFPEFMTHVREVRASGEGRSHWKVEGPLGTTVQWDAETTRREPPHRLSWKTLPGSAVQHAGSLELEPADGGTRVHVRMGYNPVAGVAGHAVASLLGSNPKKQLDDDLLRLKSLVEAGVRPHDAARR
jgi:uncharacterized membrane protein